MRAGVCGWLVAGLLVAAASPARADDQADMRALVDKAIKAAGGQAKLKKLKAVTWKAKGSVHADNRDIEITMEASMQAADQGRLDLTAEVNGNTVTIALVLNRDKGWVKHPKSDKVEAIPKELLAVFNTDFRAVRLAQMLTPLKDKACTLSSLGEVKIDDRPALGIKVVRKGHADVDIFFDKKTHLPVKCQTKVKESKGGQEVTHDYFFSDAKKTAGVLHFTKVTFKRDDKTFLEVELSDIETVDKLDDSTFAKPD
jgi:hypothetical protein